MLETVDVGVQCITCYGKSTYPEEVEKLREYAKHLRGLRAVHINATPYGGVAEILRSEMPLLRDLGIKAGKGIHIFTNLTGVSNVEVNALQRLSSVIIQKSIREGFGLVVSESLWKGTPVVAGNAGGIPIQMQNGAGGISYKFR